MTLEERDGKTYYQSLVVHDSAVARDMHIQSGMEHGANLALDRLEDIARSLMVASRGGEPTAPGERPTPPREARSPWPRA